MASRATRDLGISRINTMTRWMAGGALVIGGVLSAAVAKVLPGHSSHHSSSGAAVAPPPAPSSSQSDGADGSGAVQSPEGSGQNGSGAALAPPAQAPQPVQAQPVVNSGGS